MFKFNKKTELIVKRWAALSWEPSEPTARFEPFFNMAKRHNVKVTNMTFWAANEYNDGLNLINFELEGDIRDVDNFLDSCYEAKELSFFGPKK